MTTPFAQSAGHLGHESIHSDVPVNTREWTAAKFETSVRNRGRTPEERLLAVFDVLDDIINRADREARSFLTALAAPGAGNTGQHDIDLMLELRKFVSRLTTEAHTRDPDEFTRSWRVLTQGAIATAANGDLTAARSARAMADDLIRRHRPLDTARAITDLSNVGFDVDLEDSIDEYEASRLGKGTRWIRPAADSAPLLSEDDYALAIP